MVPPTMSARPSGRTTIPLQNMSQETGCVVITPVAGSKSPAWKFVLPGAFPDPETIRTFPLCSMATWTGLIGIEVDEVVHWPNLSACAARYVVANNPSSNIPASRAARATKRRIEIPFLGQRKVSKHATHRVSGHRNLYLGD